MRSSLFFCLFLQFLLPSTESQSLIFESLYEFNWNQRSGNVRFRVQRDPNLPLGTNVPIECSYSQGTTPESTFENVLETFNYDNDLELISFDIPITWGGAGTSPGGFAQIACVGGISTINGTARVQLLFPPAVAIYPEKLFLPRNNANEGESYSFKVTLTEKPTENVVISCQLSNTTTTNPLTITFVNVLVTPQDFLPRDVFFSSQYDIATTEGTTEDFTCRAASNNGGNQYLKETSVSNTATFEVQGLSISLNPRFQTIRSQQATVFLEIDQVQGIDIFFNCGVFGSTVDFPVNASECTSNLTLDTWQAVPTNVKVPKGAKKSIIRLQNTEPTSQIQNVYVYCCGTEYNANKTAQASINVVYSITQLGQSATPEEYRNGEAATLLDDPKWVNPAKCQCDLLANECDINCCCDSECSTQTLALFNCISETGGGFNQNLYDKSCDNSQDLNPFFCIHRSYTNWLGYYYPDVATVSSEQDSRFDLSVGYQSRDPQVSYIPDSTLTRGEYIGAILAGQNVFLPFPQQIVPGICSFGSRAQFLIDRTVSCPIENSRSNCEKVTSPLNARNYMLSPDRTFPRPLSYYAFSDANITSLFFCPENDSNDRTSFLELCWFSDQGVLPPEPTFDSTSETCSNVVLEVTYNFKWQGTAIVGVETSFVLGTIAASVDSIDQLESFDHVEFVETSEVPRNQTEPPNDTTIEAADYIALAAATVPTISKARSGVAQKFNLSFTYQTTDETSLRSGNPGYISGLPVRTASGNLTNGSLIALQLDSTILRFPKATREGLCDSSTDIGIDFRTNITSSCFVELKDDDFSDCVELGSTIRGKLPAISENVYVGRRGNSQVNNLGDWVLFITDSENSGTWGNYGDFIQEVLENKTVEETPATQNITDIYQDRQGICRNMPVGYSMEFLVTDVGMLHGVVQYEIISSRLRWRYANLELNCFKVTKSNLCTTGSSDTQNFLITSHVKFFSIPNPETQPRKPKSELLREERENCETNDICWSNMFFPLRKPPGSDRVKFLLFQENIFFTLSIAIVTLFIWRFSSTWMGKLQQNDFNWPINQAFMSSKFVKLDRFSIWFYWLHS